MKLLLDMNLPRIWVEALKLAGHQAIAWRDTGDKRAADAEILAYAAANDMVVMTGDLDFGALLAAGGASSPSVVLVRADDLVHGACLDEVIRVLAAEADALHSGALISVDEHRSRVRRLPLRRADPC